MLLRAFRAFYRSQGPRYPRLILWLQLQVSHVVVAGGIALLTKYQPLGEHFWEIFVAGEVLLLVENVIAYRVMSRMLDPLDAWMRGDRSEASAVQAWRCLAALPSRAPRC